MTSYVRGNTVHFAATFLDVNGDPFIPTAPVIVISYPSTAGREETVSIALALSAGVWVADWDSYVASRESRIYWTVYSGSPDPKIAADGNFTLAANKSNLVAV